VCARAGTGEIADARDRAWRIVAMSAPHGEKKQLETTCGLHYIKLGTKQHKKCTNLIDGVVNF
jgi:hypothetical protein